MHRSPYEYPPEEHWKRIQRWRQRLREVHSDDSADFLDHAVVVLLHCFSMRDWLINSGVDEKSVRKLYESDALKVCRDVANGTKHLSITKPSVDKDHAIVRSYRPWRQPDESESELQLLAGGVSYTLRDFCGECVRQIGEFMAALPQGKGRRLAP